MEFAIQVSGAWDDVLAAARYAEGKGLPALALPDHYLMARDEDKAKTTPAPDGLIQLAGLARETERLELVVLVAPITFRHPAVLAKTAATIDEMSGGRFTLGIGTGWMDREHEVFGLPYPPIGERFEMMEEALAYVRATFDEKATGFQGKHYQLEPFPITPRPNGTVKLLVGGTGARKTPYLAGTYADEFNVYPGPDLTERIARFRNAAVEAGRDPDRILLSSAGQVVAAATEEGVEERLDEIALEVNVDREKLAEGYRRRRTPIGTYEQVKDQLAAMAEAGVSRFYLQGRFDPERTTTMVEAFSD